MHKDNMYQLLFQAIQEGSVESIQKTACHIFDSPTAVADAAFRILYSNIDSGYNENILEKDKNTAYVSTEIVNLFREHNLISNLLEHPHKTLYVNWGDFKQHPRIVTGIFWKDQFLGTLTVSMDSVEYTEDHDEALQACANALALVMHAQDFGKKTLSTEREYFISKLFHGFAKQSDLQAATSKRFFLPSATYVVLATELIPKNDWQKQISKNPHLLFYQCEGIAYLMAPVQNADMVSFQKLVANRGYRFGLSYQFSDPLLASKMARQAASVLAYGNQSDPKKVEWSFPEHALDMMIHETPNATDFIHPGLLEMEQYDKNNRTEYLNTLWTWLNEKMDYSRTAKLLHLHRNSLYYRMERIRELFSLDLDDMNINVQLFLSLREYKFK